MRGRRTEKGSALVAALILQLVLLLAALQLALSATTARLAVSRGAALMQAEQLAESAVAQGLELAPADLEAALAAGGETPVAAPPGSDLPAPRLIVRDDDDGDDDPARDRNGRLLLEGVGAAAARRGLVPSRATLVREAWVGGLLPLAGAVLACSDGPWACGGEDGCAVPLSRVRGEEAAALARPFAAGPELRLRLLRLTREVLRRCHRSCLDAAGCEPADETLWRAAATGVLRLVEGPDTDATTLAPERVALLVQELLGLIGDESGPGEMVWWDGSRRALADRAALVAALESLARGEQHVPDLTAHPYPAVLSGTAEWADGEGVCSRLPGLLAAAEAGAARGAAGAGEVTVWAEDRRLAAGAVETGRGLLVVKGRLEVDAGALLSWTGSLALAGGRVVGSGRLAIAGSVVLLPPSSPQAMDISATSWDISADPEAHRRAWSAAGTLPGAAWWPLDGE